MSVMATALLAFIVFLLLSERFGVLIATAGLIAGVLGLFLEPIVGWWTDCARLWWIHRATPWLRAHSPRTRSDNFDSP